MMTVMVIREKGLCHSFILSFETLVDHDGRVTSWRIIWIRDGLEENQMIGSMKPMKVG